MICKFIETKNFFNKQTKYGVENLSQKLYLQFRIG